MEGHRFRFGRRDGQSIVESVLVILVACFIFFTLFQYAHLFACKTILSHAAARAARARTVGFNEWMVRKSALVASIPASGKRLSPNFSTVDGTWVSALARKNTGSLIDMALHATPTSPGYLIEVGRIPEFMESDNEASSTAVLDYELWERTEVDLDESFAFDGESPASLAVRVKQRHPLLFSLEPLREGKLVSVNEDAEGGGDEEDLALAGEFSIESHYPLYLEDAKW